MKTPGMPSIDLESLPRRACRRHGQVAPAGWHCDSCRADLCADCVTTESMVGVKAVPRCTTCGRPADPIMLKRSVLASYATRLPGSLAAPLRSTGLITMVAIGGAIALLRLIGPLGEVIAAVTLAVLLFHLIRSSADGDDEQREWAGNPLAATLRGAFGVAPILIPAALHVSAEAGSIRELFSNGLPDSEALLSDPLIIGTLVALLLYGPMTAVVASCENGLFRMLNPAVMVAAIARVAADYAVLVGALGGLLVLRWVIVAVSGAVLPDDVPFLPAWAENTLALYPLFAGAHALGLLMYTRGDDLGFAAPSRYREAILGATKPRGKMGHGSFEAPNAGRTSWGPPRSVADKVASLIGAGNLDLACAFYRDAHPSELEDLPPRLHYEIGRRAQSRGSAPLAVRAFWTAASTAGDPIAPYALAEIVRIHADQLKDMATATRICRMLIDRYPTTEVARIARRWFETVTRPAR